MRSDRTALKPNGESGFILIVVLWVLAALAALASIYLVYADNTAFATQLNDDRLRIRNAISTGIELTAYKLLAAPKDKDKANGKDKDARPPQGAFTVRLSRSTINVTFVSEAARVDLNAAPKPLLAGLFTTVGVSPSNAATYADRIVGWRTRVGAAGQNNAAQDNAGQNDGGQTIANQGVAGQADASQNNAGQRAPGQINAGQGDAGQDSAGQNKEADTYKAAGYAYPPRQAPFQNVLELPLVLGIPPYIVERVLPLVTVYSGSAQIDVRVAPPEVLSALPNVTPEGVQKVLAQRAHDPLDGESLLGLLGAARTAANANPNPAARIRMQIRLDNGRIALAEVVILVSQGEDEPYRVLSWRDDSDGSI
jgi:general secretion pathway protein K